jgi:uncharacterized protein YjbI with pentapeptide repeats
MILSARAFAAIVLALGLVTAAPAMAQNAAQIEHVKQGASCPRCNLFQADFGNRVLKNRNFAGARLRQADFSLSAMDYSNLSNTDLRDANAYAARFTGVDLHGANMTNASFVGVYMGGVNLRGARVDGVNFSGSEMSKTKGLTQAQLNRACGDETTTLPKGLHIPACK